MTITVTVESSPSPVFEPGGEYEMADFMTWVSDDSVPEGLLVRAGERYYVIAGGRLARCDAEGCVDGPQRGRPPGQTDTWERILEALADSAEEGGLTPSYRELADMAGVSMGSVSHHLNRLERQGLVVRAAGVHRGTRITPLGMRRAERLAFE